MSDERLRQLERRWRESGDAADEEPFLRERYRRGLIRRADLRVAAYLGHRIAQELLGDEALFLVPPAGGMHEFMHGLPDATTCQRTPPSLCSRRRKRDEPNRSSR